MCLDFGVCAPQSASFALATTHSLDVLLNASRPYHRSPSACLEGTHGDRVAGDNANAIDFVTIASSLCATSSTRIDCYRSLFMSLVRGRKESKLVRSLVLHIKLGVRLARRRCGSCSAFEVAHSVNKHALNECFVRPLQEFFGVYSKLDVPPLSLTGFSPTTQLGAILYKIIRRSWGRQSALA